MLLAVLQLASLPLEPVWWRERDIVHILLLLYLIRAVENDEFLEWRDELL